MRIAKISVRRRPQFYQHVRVIAEASKFHVERSAIPATDGAMQNALPIATGAL